MPVQSIFAAYAHFGSDTCCRHPRLSVPRGIGGQVLLLRKAASAFALFQTSTVLTNDLVEFVIKLIPTKEF